MDSLFFCLVLLLAFNICSTSFFFSTTTYNIFLMFCVIFSAIGFWRIEFMHRKNTFLFSVFSVIFFSAQQSFGYGTNIISQLYSFVSTINSSFYPELIFFSFYLNAFFSFVFYLPLNTNTYNSQIGIVFWFMLLRNFSLSIL